MFKIILSPIASTQNDTPPTLNGQIITYRGEGYDLSGLPVGAEVEAEAPFIGSIKNVDGVFHLTLQYEYDATMSQDNQSTDWADYTFDVVDGICPCPILRKSEPEPVIEPQIEEVENDN